MPKDFKKRIAETRQDGPVRVGIPQVDPSESVKVPLPSAGAPQASPIKAQATEKPGAGRRGKKAKAEDLPMPPSRRSPVKVQFNQRLEPGLANRIRAFIDDLGADVQDTAELAWDEFLGRRGY